MSAVDRSNNFYISKSRFRWSKTSNFDASQDRACAANLTIRVSASSPFEYFYHIIDDEMIGLIVTCTNTRLGKALN